VTNLIDYTAHFETQRQAMLLIFYSDCNKRMRDRGGEEWQRALMEDGDTCECGYAS
jgi:hypothetical protein